MEEWAIKTFLLPILPVLVVFLGLGYLITSIKQLGWKGTLKDMGEMLSVMTILFLAVFMNFKSDAILKALSRWFGLYGMRSLVSLFVIGFGFGAHLWKQKNQRSYGLSEVLFGIVAGTFIMFTLTPDKSFLSQWVGLGGAAYIIARGMNNVAEAKKKKLEEQEAELRAKAEAMAV